MSHEIQEQRFFNAPVEDVWKIIEDHCGMDRWLVPGMKIRLDPEGEPSPNGVGAVRIIERQGFRVTEEVLAFEPPNHMAYTVLSGFPIKNHRGEIYLKEQNGGCELSWNITFEGKVPGLGWPMKLIVRRVIGKGLNRLGEIL